MSASGRKFMDEQEQAEMTLAWLGVEDPQDAAELIERYGPKRAVIEYVRTLSAEFKP